MKYQKKKKNLLSNYDLQDRIGKKLGFSSKDQIQASAMTSSSARASPAGALSGASLAGALSGASVFIAEN